MDKNVVFEFTNYRIMIKNPLREEGATRMRGTGLKNSIRNWDRLFDSKLIQAKESECKRSFR